MIYVGNSGDWNMHIISDTFRKYIIDHKPKSLIECGN